MMRIGLFLLIGLIVLSCSTEEPNLVVNGQIRGLKKGTLYLERQQDTSWIPIDSMIINGESEFVLQAALTEPEVMMLRLDVANTKPQRLRFFGAQGMTTVNTSLKRFFYDAKITGSQQQELLNEFNSMIGQFNEKNLELIKSQLESANDSVKIQLIQKNLDQLMKRKYLYAINFAITNKSSQVAPYIALNEVFDANVKYLDTIYNSLPDSIAGSKYGTKLNSYIKELKKQGNNE
ncbi:MAG: DUF4369 domain-containing protein [Flavobacteriaceae bacterium]|nr:DUF4369 domain-containing protein [Bacteroidia bacterium]NNF74203.1 DUF4369 domain-containing protein [Flavobacteriaceae bacterium]NNK72221.1 DUF4369 domain-containing protein [Flavobacteriaceae bacterium]